MSANAVKKEPVEAANRRTHGSRAESTEARCKMNLKVFFLRESEEWHFSKRGDATLEYTYHHRIHEEKNPSSSSYNGFRLTQHATRAYVD